MVSHQLVHGPSHQLGPRYGVDLVFNGHVHSYERSFPVYNNSVNECSWEVTQREGTGKEIQTEDWWFAGGFLEVVAVAGGLLVGGWSLSLRIRHEQGFRLLLFVP